MFIWKCRFFQVFFVPLPFSLYMESTTHVLSFRMVFFYLVTAGWIFDISLLRQKSINQLNHSITVGFSSLGEPNWISSWRPFAFFADYVPTLLNVFTLFPRYISVVLCWPYMRLHRLLLLYVVCVLSSHFFWTSDLWTHQPGVTETKEEGHAGFLHLPSAVLAFIFIARRIQLSLTLVDRELEFCVPTNYSFFTCWAFIYLFVFVRKNPSSCDCTAVRTHVPTWEGFEVIANWTTGRGGRL